MPVKERLRLGLQHGQKLDQNALISINFPDLRKGKNRSKPIDALFSRLFEKLRAKLN
ncbi:MAG: hypothetical protein AAGA74_19115 [Pseudomonadota bacterium]